MKTSIKLFAVVAVSIFLCQLVVGDALALDLESMKQKVGKPKRLDWGVGFWFGKQTHYLGDFKTSKKMWMQTEDYTTSARDFGSSWVTRVNLFTVYNFPNRHRLGLGFGYRYLSGGMFEFRQGRSDDAATMDETEKFKVGAHGVPISAFYLMPLPWLRIPFFLRFGLGLGFYCSAIDFSYSYSYIYTDPAMQEYNQTLSKSGKFRDKTTGSFFFLGFEYFVCPMMGVKFGIEHHCVIFDDYTATVTRSDGTEYDARLNMYRSEHGEVIGVGSKDAQPSDTVRPARVDLGGWGFMLGVNFYLPCFLF